MGQVGQMGRASQATRTASANSVRCPDAQGMCTSVAGGEAGERYLDVGGRSDLVMGTLACQNDASAGVLS